MNTNLYPEESYRICGAIYEVHKHLGCGFLEKVYQDALALELQKQDIPFERECRFRIEYKGECLPTEYVADFVCYDKIILELKAVDVLQPIHEAQVINYLKVTGFKLGILVNFNELKIQPKRLVRF